MFRTNPSCSWRIAAAAILSFVVAASVDELRAEAFAFTSFATTPSRASNLLTGARPIPTPTSSSSSSRLQFFSGYEMGGVDAVNNNNNNKKNKSKSKDKGADSSDERSPSNVETEDPLFYVALVTKMVIILAIKTAKDVINYPPNLLDQYNRNQQIRNQEIAADLIVKTVDVAPVALLAAEEIAQGSTSTVTPSRDTSSDISIPLPLELTKTNPFILFAKLIGVLAYKTLHDSIYYPALWINDSLHPPRNDDNYNYY